LRAISLTTAAYQDSSLRKLDRSRPLPFVTGRRRRQRQAMLQSLLMQFRVAPTTALPVKISESETSLLTSNSNSNLLLPRTIRDQAMEALTAIWPIVTRRHPDRVAHIIAQVTRVVQQLTNAGSLDKNVTAESWSWTELEADVLYVNALCGRLIQSDCLCGFYLHWSSSSSSSALASKNVFSSSSSSELSTNNDECMLIPLLQSIHRLAITNTNTQTTIALQQQLPNLFCLNDCLVHYSNKYYVLHSWSPASLLDDDYWLTGGSSGGNTSHIIISPALTTAMQRWDFVNGCGPIMVTSSTSHSSASAGMMANAGFGLDGSPRRAGAGMSPSRLNSVRRRADGSLSGLDEEKQPPLEFDPSRCSDSIAVLDPAAAAASSNSVGSGSTSMFTTPASRRSAAATSSSTHANPTGGPVSVSQRASKVWGCVYATWAIPPNSGVQSWAVHLDKCDRGHVFVGVVTSQASIKTYVGGDGHGWGMIGTKALWHDRSKIRGDYGSTFRTGATVIVTLDSNVGTLRFGILRDSNNIAGGRSPGSTAASSSTPGTGGGGPTVEDWGIAFEGLPLNVNLFPAVGLYQRDDGVTLKTMSSILKSNPAPGSGDVSASTPNDNHHRLSSSKLRLANRFSSSSTSSDSSRAKQANHQDAVRWDDAAVYTTFMLRENIQLLVDGDRAEAAAVRDYSYKVVESLLSSLLLSPSSLPDEIQQLHASKYWIRLLPLLQWTLQQLEQRAKEVAHAAPGDKATKVVFKQGKWKVTRNANLGGGQTSTTGASSAAARRLSRKITGSMQMKGEASTTSNNNTASYSSRPEEYTIDLRCKHDHAVAGHNKPPHMEGSGSSSFAQRPVSIQGTMHGNRFLFTEEWGSSASTSGSSSSSSSSQSVYLCDTRVSPDGTSFVGSCYSAATGKLVYEIDAVSVDVGDDEVKIDDEAQLHHCLRELSRLTSLAMGQVTSFLVNSVDVVAEAVFRREYCRTKSTPSGASISSSSLLHKNPLFLYGRRLPEKSNNNDIETSHVRKWIQEECSISLCSVIRTKSFSQKEVTNVKMSFDEWLESSKDDTTTIGDDSSSRLLNLKDVEALDAWVKKHHLGAVQGSLSRLAPKDFDSTRLRLLQCMMYHTKTFAKFQSQMHDEKLPSDAVTSLWRKALLCLEDLVRKSLQSKNKENQQEDSPSLSHKEKIATACSVIRERALLLLELEPCISDEGSAEEMVTDEVIQFVTSSKFTMAQWDATLHHIQLVSITSWLKNCLLRPLNVTLEQVSSNCICANEVWDGIGTMLAPILSIPSSGRFDFAKYNNSAAAISGDWDRSYHYLDGLVGCSRSNLRQLCVTLRSIYTQVGHRLSYLVKNDTEQVSSSSPQSDLILLLLSAWCIPMPCLPDANSLQDGVPLLLAALDTNILSTLAAIRRRHQDVAFASTSVSSSTGDGASSMRMTDSLAQHVSHELYHASWATTQILLTQVAEWDSSQTHAAIVVDDDLRRLGLLEKPEVLGTLVEDFALQARLAKQYQSEFDSMKLKETANEQFTLFLKESRVFDTKSSDLSPDLDAKNRISSSKTAATAKGVVVPKLVKKPSRSAAIAFSFWMSTLWKPKTEIVFPSSPSSISISDSGGALDPPSQTYSYMSLLSMLDMWFTFSHLQCYRSSASPSFVAAGQTLLKTQLLPFLENGNKTPIFVQTRILRLLRLMIPGVEGVVEDAATARALVETALTLASSGSGSPTSSDDNEAGLSIAREAVSFIRFLLCLDSSSKIAGNGNIDWKAIVSGLFEQVVSSATENDVYEGQSKLLLTGCLNVLSGQTVTDMCLAVGCHVLLPRSNSSPSAGSKASGGSASATAGSNLSYANASMNQVLAGLARHTADAGIVIGFDHDRGGEIVEVLLLQNRNAYGSYLSKMKNDEKNDMDQSPPLSSIAGGGVAVRALKVNTSDVVLVTEFPLIGAQHFAKSIPQLIQLVVSTADISKPAHDKITNSLEMSVLAARALCTILADSTALKQYLSLSQPQSHLDLLLRITSLAPHDSLSTLAQHGSHLSFLQAVSKDLAEKKSTVKQYLDMSHWQSKLSSEFKETQKAKVVSEALQKLEAQLDTPARAESATSETGSDGGGLSTNAARAMSSSTVDSSTTGINQDRSTSEATSRMTSDGTNISASLRQEDAATASNAEHEAARIDASGTIANGVNDAEELEDDDEEEEDEEDSIQLSEEDMHLREAAIAQMAELGLPRSWAQIALHRTTTRSTPVNVEGAVHFCLERGGVEMERMVATDRERDRERRRRTTGGGDGDAVGASSISSRSAEASAVLHQLFEMGFPSQWCNEALAAVGNNVDEALSWILTNGERLASMESNEGGDDDEEQQGDDAAGAVAEDVEAEADEDSSEETDEDEADVNKKATAAATKAAGDSSEDPEELASAETVNHNVVCPLRFVSGQSIVDPKTQVVSGLANGGFSSVGTYGILLTSGKWYYEATLLTAGCLQIGWADSSFHGHCHADRGDGCGDGPSSWAYDGWRRYKWHGVATEWGARWSLGDVVGCCIDLDDEVISFTLNGRGGDVGMGVAFTDIRPVSGVYPCVSFNRKEKLLLSLGGDFGSLKYGPPEGYRPVGDYVNDKVQDYDTLMKLEKQFLPNNANIINAEPSTSSSAPPQKRYLCNFSDGEHGHELFAWQHRYYGSDASVHLGSSSSSKSPTSLTDVAALAGAEVTSSEMASGKLLQALWKQRVTNNSIDKEETSPLSSSNPPDVSKAVAMMEQDYTEGIQEICHSADAVSQTLVALYCKKLVLNLMISLKDQFSIHSLFDCINTADNADNEDGNAELFTAQKVFGVLESCVSLRSTGWVGEAGTMAIAAEALGLGISSSQSTAPGAAGGISSSTASSSPTAIAVVSKQHGIVMNALQQAPGWALQLTGSELMMGSSPQQNGDLVACAESALVHEGSGMLLFLRDALMAMLRQSYQSRGVFVAGLQKMVRTLSSVEFAKDETAATSSDSDEESGKTPSKGSSSKDDPATADARFASFLTGLILSVMHQQMKDDADNALAYALFEAWSIGCLSGSAPWRMVCAYTASGILNVYPNALEWTTSRVSTLSQFYANLGNAVTRRMWAERAASPVCSQYVQAMTDLWTAVKSSGWRGAAQHPMVDSATPKPLPFISSSIEEENEALLKTSSTSYSSSSSPSWESLEGWVSSDQDWDIWTGTLHILPVEWKKPPLYSGRTLVDGGEGPLMLHDGCFVMRGVDWDQRRTSAEDSEDEDDSESKCHQQTCSNEDGKAEYDAEKESRRVTPVVVPVSASDDPAAEDNSDSKDEGQKEASSSAPAPVAKKAKKGSLPKLPVGTVIGSEPWNGIPGRARRVRWNRTGEEGVYRLGGDGGRFDIVHVDVNSPKKQTRVTKRHPYPETTEQCMMRHGFSLNHKYHVMLRLCKPTSTVLSCDNDDNEDETTQSMVECEGILEYPDLGAAVHVSCTQHSDGGVTLLERDLIYGSKDHGWETRFGQASYKPGTCIILSPTRNSGGNVDTNDGPESQCWEQLWGSDSCEAAGGSLRNKETGEAVRITSELRLTRNRRKRMNVKKSRKAGPACSPSLSSSLSVPSILPPIKFDDKYHPPSFALSRDGSTLTCKSSSEGRGTAFANMGFTKGVHYWEVRVEQADIGSVFIGVAEKPKTSGTSGSASSNMSADGTGVGVPRLNRWLGHGFVNFRATYNAGAERVFGAHAHAGDTIGVLLDCDAGRLSFFLDGVKYGEHLMTDLGCAFENLSAIGFNADGCGGGGASQGAPNAMDRTRDRRYSSNGMVQPKPLWPVVGLRSPGDRVSFATKWMTGYGPDGVATMRNASKVDELLRCYERMNGQSSLSSSAKVTATAAFPSWFVTEAFGEYKRWRRGQFYRTATRGSGPLNLSSHGLDADLDTSPKACAFACAMLGLKEVYLPGDKVLVRRSFGRLLEIPEEATVLGSLFGRLYYRISNQRSEGSSLSEGGGRPWYWDESEVVDDGVTLFGGDGKGLGIRLPLISKFRCSSRGGLKVIYSGGAVVRSDLEIFDGSSSMGVVQSGNVIPMKNVLERRVNSCGVVRYRIRHPDVGVGWISARIRGGKEEPIIEFVYSVADDEGGDGDDDSNDKNPATEGEDAASAAENEFEYAEDSAAYWLDTYRRECKKLDAKTTPSSMMSSGENNSHLDIKTVDEFQALLNEGVLLGGEINAADSDSILALALSRVSDELPEGDGDPMNSNFHDVAVAIDYALGQQFVAGGGVDNDDIHREHSTNNTAWLGEGHPSVNHAAASVLSVVDATKAGLAKALSPPSLKAVMARLALLRALNRRVQYALPWLSVQPIQQSSSVFGGTEGFGVSLNRAGRRPPQEEHSDVR
jgi:hypothetical protein